MVQQQIEPVHDLADEVKRLKTELHAAREALIEAEAELAEEQAAVNAFRMHCRLKLDRWIEQLIELQTKRQSLLTRLQLLRQAEDLGIPYDEADSFWQGEEENTLATEDEDELLLPTDVPRDKAAEKRLFRRLARRFHPDLGQTTLEIAYRTDMMTAVNRAYAADDIQALYDLADQIDPEELAELSAVPSFELRSLRRQLIRLRQRRRKAERRLATLREENTARLWQKAQSLDKEDVNWWEIVRQEIERAIERVSGDVHRLKEELVDLDHLEKKIIDFQEP